MNKKNVIGLRRPIVIGMMYLLLAGVVFGEDARETASYSTLPAKDQRTWFQRTFKRISMEEAVSISSSPADICREVSRHVSYRSDYADHWMSSDETWLRGRGDCEDFAVLVQDMCKRLGVEVSIHLYFPAGRPGEGHAVAVGQWQGRYWVSSNGAYQEVESLEAVRDVISREMSWESDEVWSSILRPSDVQRFVQRDRDAFSS